MSYKQFSTVQDNLAGGKPADAPAPAAAVPGKPAVAPGLAPAAVAPETPAKP